MQFSVTHKRADKLSRKHGNNRIFLEYVWVVTVVCVRDKIACLGLLFIFIEIKMRTKVFELAITKTINSEKVFDTVVSY